MPQNIILCIEPSKNPYEFPEAMGNLFINKFVIDEEAAFEIVDIFILPERCKYETEKNLLRNAIRKTMLAGAPSLPIHIFWTIWSQLNLKLKTSVKVCELKKIICQLRTEFKIDSVLLTTIHWARFNLINKEVTEELYKSAELFKDVGDVQSNWQEFLHSGNFPSIKTLKPLHDDMDVFFQAMSSNDELTQDRIDNVEFLKPQLLFTSQKLTNTELALLAKMDGEFMATFAKYNGKTYNSQNYNVQKQSIENDMKTLQLSESKSRYKFCNCVRSTFVFDRIRVRDHDKILQG